MCICIFVNIVIYIDYFSSDRKGFGNLRVLTPHILIGLISLSGFTLCLLQLSLHKTILHNYHAKIEAFLE